MLVRLLNSTRENIEQHGRRQLSKFGGGGGGGGGGGAYWTRGWVREGVPYRPRGGGLGERYKLYAIM